jgi:hypothetical protein
MRPEEILRAFITAEMDDDEPPDEQGLREDGGKVQLQCRVALEALTELASREAAVVPLLERMVAYDIDVFAVADATALLARIRRGQG